MPHKITAWTTEEILRLLQLAGQMGHPLGTPPTYREGFEDALSTLRLQIEKMDKKAK